MKKPRLKTLAAGGIASVTLLVAAAAYAADIGQLKDGTGQGVRTGHQDCVQTSGAGAQNCDGAAAAAPAAAPAAASSAAPAESSSSAAAAAPAVASTAGAGGASDHGHVGTGGGAGVRTGTGTCLHTGGGGGAGCGDGGAPATAASAPAEAPAAKPAGATAAPAAAAVAGPEGAAAAGITGAGHDATSGHLRNGHNAPVRTGGGECVNLGHAAGKDHPADCVIQAPAAMKSPDPAAAPAAAAVPPPEKVAEPAAAPAPKPAPAPETPAPKPYVATVPTDTEGADPNNLSDPATKWSKEGAPAEMAKPAEPAPQPESAPPATAEAPAAVVAQPETPYPAPMPQFPEIEPQAQPQEQGPIGDAPPYEVPGPNVGGAAAPETVDTKSMAAEEGGDPATKWSKEGAPAEKPAEVAAAPAPEPTPEPVAELKTPESPAAPAAATVPPPEQVATPPAPPAPAAQPDKVPAPEYEKFVLAADALFHFDRYTRKYMLPEGKQKLDDLAAALNRYTGVESFNVIGHTDRIGSHKYNDRLSLRRAATVKQYLAEKGVDANLMKISGKGKRQPIVNCPGKKVTKKLKACLQANRRVEVEVRGEGQKK